MLTAWYLVTFFMLAVRLVVVVAFATHGGPLGFLYAFAESVALFFAVVNLSHAAAVRDVRPVGLAVPLLYAVASLVIPAPQAAQAWVVWVMAAVVLAKLSVRWSLGKAFTVGPAAWVGLRDGGAYGVVRHPMMALSVAIRLVLLAGNLTVWNVAITAVFVLVVVVEVWIEEGFLIGVDSWREYANRVRWRLVPGLW